MADVNDDERSTPIIDEMSAKCEGPSLSYKWESRAVAVTRMMVVVVVVVAAVLLKSATNSTLLLPCAAKDPQPARAEDWSPEPYP